jgi:hypothetical protein
MTGTLPGCERLRALEAAMNDDFNLSCPVPLSDYATVQLV